jgi:glycine dehydrogenase subunit 1
MPWLRPLESVAMAYTAATEPDLRHMLDVIGVASVEELFAAVPEGARPPRALDLPSGLSEPELVRRAHELAAQVVDASRVPTFLGGGMYDHFIPAVVRTITSRSEFATAYTPYQPEVSQGTLQTIFEFQSAIAALAGLPVANASLYDGATSVAEAACLAEQTTRRSEIVVLGTVSAQARAVLATYAGPYGLTVRVVEPDLVAGCVDPARVKQELSSATAAVVVQHPNAWGVLEDVTTIVADAEAAGAVAVVSADPLSLGVLAAPGSYGADVVVGDGQPIGIAPSGGGPSFGFMATSERFVRRLPGRIVGESVDADGERCFVLTLQTREQHIRREKATSNICTNQALCALAGLVHLSWLGPDGIQELGARQFERAHALRARLLAVPGISAGPGGADAPVFRECVVQLDAPATAVVDRCVDLGVLAGSPAGTLWPELGSGALLVAAREPRSDADIELLAGCLEQAIREERA